MNKRIQMRVKLLLTLWLSVSWGACNYEENALISRASKIQKGMRIYEVINILGSPKFAAIIESSKIGEGWDNAWKPSYEEMLTKHSKVLYYVYGKGVVYINVCFDLEEQKVVYVSRFLGTI